MTGTPDDPNGKRIAHPKTDTLNADAEHMFRRFTHSNIVAICHADIHGNIIDLNEAFCDLVGYTRDELMQVGWRPITPREYDALDDLAVAQLKKDGRVVPYFKEYIHKDGHRVPIMVSIASLDKDGEQCVAVILDVSVQKRVEDELRHNEAQFRMLADAIPNMVWTADSSGRTDYCNQRFYDFVGYTPDDDDGFLWQKTLHPDDLPLCIEEGEKARTEKRVFEKELRYRSRDGSYRWQLVRAFPVYDLEGNPTKWFGTCTDIHNNRTAEEHFRQLADVMPQIVYTNSNDSEVTYLNKRWYEFTGADPTSGMGFAWKAAVHPDDLLPAMEKFERCKQNKEPFEGELRQLHVSGEYRWTLARSVPVLDEKGNITQWIGTATDIDDKKVAEEELRESEARLRTLAEAIPQIVWTANPSGEIVFFNSRWFEYTGLTIEQSLDDQGWHLLLHTDDSARYFSEWGKAVKTGDSFEMEFRLKRAVGLGKVPDYRWHLGRAVAMRSRDGKILQWFGTWTDIDDQRG